MKCKCNKNAKCRKVHDEKESESENDIIENDNENENDIDPGVFIVEGFSGVNLHLLESIYVQDQNPNTLWLLKIAKFCECSLEKVENWFKVRRNM